MNPKDGFPGYKEHVVRNAGDAPKDQYGLQPDGRFRVRGNAEELLRGLAGSITPGKMEVEPPPQAMKASHGKVMLHLLPPGPIYDIARVREFGSEKYAPWDWTIGRNHTDYYDAVMRHMLAWLTGEDNDPESGLSHLAHAGCTLLFMIEHAKTGKGLDNRPSGLLRNPMAETR